MRIALKRRLKNLEWSQRRMKQLFMRAKIEKNRALNKEREVKAKWQHCEKDFNNLRAGY